MSSRRVQRAAQRYHDRVAGQYDAIYDDAYWAWHDRLTWEHMRAYLPRRLGVRALDLGCGTGKWGLRLLESGFAVTFVDISAQMLDQARAKVASTSYAGRAEFVHADLMNLDELTVGAFEFAAAMGEPIGSAESPAAALRQIRERLSDEGCLVATFDNRLACIDHFVGARPTHDVGARATPGVGASCTRDFTKSPVDELAEFLKAGRTHWLTRDRQEQFAIHTYTPAQLRQLLERSGFECADMIGKTVLPMRAHRERLTEPKEARHWADIEKGLHRVEAALGRCAHLQVAARARAE